MSTVQTDAMTTGTPALRDRVLGCWRGKAIGGTLGQSFEGLPGPIAATWYQPEPDGMVPNDDLDIQLVYAQVLADMEQPAVHRDLIARAWLDHLAFPWHEYAIGRRNVLEGIAPPHSGSFDNWFCCGEGAVIRSEIWACLAAGDPALAAAYAYEDACFDHAHDGIWAAAFMAAAQAAAFVETDLDTIIDLGLAQVPPTSRIHDVVADTRAWVATGLPWQKVMTKLVARYGTDDFTDTRMNTGFVVLGLLSSRGDFEKAIVTTNGCGGDTDSTTASVGALLGILAPERIPQRWLAPIGDQIQTHPAVVGITPPGTIQEFTDLVVDLRQRLDGAPPPLVPTPDFDPDGHAIPVTVGWTTPYGLVWGERDFTGLSPEGGPMPPRPASAISTTVPGSWVRWPTEDFRDLVLVIDYTITVPRDMDAVVMFNCAEHSRVWLDGTYLCGSQPGALFPTQHRPPVGQSATVHLAAGQHLLRATVLRPTRGREYAEWIVSVAELPGGQWVPHVFRSGTAGRP